MDRDTIKSVIEAFTASDLVELEYHSNGERLRLVRRGAQGIAPMGPALAEATQTSSTPTSTGPAPEPSSQAIVAPLFGIVHLQQTPGAPPFVAAGDAVAAGRVLCVVEAMKVFNQIRAERDCIIAAVLVQSGEEVEAGQQLFRLG